MTITKLEGDTDALGPRFSKLEETHSMHATWWLHLEPLQSILIF